MINTEKSRKELIRQAVEFGNLSLISLNKDECPSAMEYLCQCNTELTTREKFYINFRTICSKSEPIVLYNSGITVLPLLRDKVAATNFLCNDNLVFPTNHSLLMKLIDIFFDTVKPHFQPHETCYHIFGLDYLECINKRERLNNSYLLFDEEKGPSLELLSKVVQLDNFKHIGKYNKSTWSMFYTHLVYLERTVPNYFKHIIQQIPKLDKYRDLLELKAQQFFTIYELLTPPKDYLLEEIKRYTFCAWVICIIAEKNKEIASYMLGFDLRRGSVSVSFIRKALLKLSQEGISKYVTNVIAAGEYISHPVLEEKSGSNNFKLYQNFDKVQFYEDEKLYTVTRNMFYQIQSNYLNPYTNKEIPQSIMCEISNRVSIAELNCLPEAKPMDKLLFEINTWISVCIKKEEDEVCDPLGLLALI